MGNELRSKWEMVRLGDMCESKIDTIKLQDNKEIIYIDIASVDNQLKEISSYSKINILNAPSRAKQILKTNDILVSTVRPNLNAVAVNNIHEEIPVIASTGYCVLRCKSEILPQYLFAFCKANQFIEELVKVAKGASYPAVSNGDVKNLKIPLPPLEIQEKIAKNLDLASNLVKLHKTKLKELDKLIQSVFYDMFGDPVMNEMGWEVEKLANIGSLGRGVSKHRPRNAPELLGGDYPLIQTGEVSNSGIYITTYQNTYSEIGLKQSKMWKKGTLCITIAANIAKTAILTFDACFPDSVVGFISGERTNQIFIYTWFRFFQRILEEQAPQSAQKNINLVILSDLKVIIPPLPLQQKFAYIVAEIEKQKQDVQNALKNAEMLYDSLMQEYFE